MNMFARFGENPAMTLRVIKETKRYGRTEGRTDNVKTVYPLQTKFAGGIKIYFFLSVSRNKIQYGNFVFQGGLKNPRVGSPINQFI